jgi:alcohol dehydrogenase (NADP+)
VHRRHKKSPPVLTLYIRDGNRGRASRIRTEEMYLLSTIVLACAVAAQKFSPSKPVKGSQLTSPPQSGLGTWYLKDQNATEAVASAIEAGYRHIDGAKIYGNQKEVGAGIKEGIRRAGIDRKDLWITSKLWNDR